MTAIDPHHQAMERCWRSWELLARTNEANRVSRAAIERSLKMLRQPIYPH